MRQKNDRSKITARSEIERAGSDAGKTSAIEISFPQEDADRVISLLRRYGGCPPGFTTDEAVLKIATTAMFLGNIASGHMRAQVDGKGCDLGMDFVVEGEMASADFRDSVISSTLWFQTRWERNVLHDSRILGSAKGGNEPAVKVKRTQDAFDSILQPIGRARRIFTKFQEKYSEQTSAGELYDVDEKLMPTDMLSVPLILHRRATLFTEATEFPHFIMEMSGTGGQRRCVAHAHLGHLIISAQLRSLACLEKLGKDLMKIGGDVSTGRMQATPTVRTNLALCADSNVFGQVFGAVRGGSSKIPGALWVVESSPGCELPAGITASPAPEFHNFGALEILRRIDFEDEYSHKLEALDGRLGGWRKFLREQEKHLPGIISAAWNLPVSLCYGFESMLKHRTRMDGGEVIAVAKWLVLRMSNRFAAAGSASQSDGARRLARKLTEKLLEHGPLTVRELTRRCSRLKKDDCQRALSWLSEHGVASPEGGVWGVVCDPEAVRERIG